MAWSQVSASGGSAVAEALLDAHVAAGDPHPGYQIEHVRLTDLSSVFTTGDLVFYDGANLVKLSIGDSGQALVVADGLPAWGSVRLSGIGTENEESFQYVDGSVLGGTYA